MANSHRIYSSLIVLLVLLLTSSLASNSRLVRVKRKAPPKYEGIVVNKAFFNNSDGEEEEAKVIRKFDKGTNSTIRWEGEPADLFCNLTRGEYTSRFRVVWRIQADGQYQDPDTLRKSEKFLYNETSALTLIRIPKVAMSDKGWYQCALWDSKPHDCSQFQPGCIVSTYEIQLRVKDRMDKIYPSVSIGVEVVLLFIIILVYETRKSKVEAEESDTDGSPDQKNVSDTNGEGVSEATRLAKD